MDYTNVDIQDLIVDEKFIRWVKNPDRETDRFWSEFLAIHPHKRPMVEEAKGMVAAISFKEFYPSSLQIDRIYDDIQGRLQREKVDTAPQPTKRIWFNPWLVAACMTCLLALVGWTVWNSYFKKETYFATQFGELKSVTLADGTVVKLNGNTQMHIARHLDKSAKREVWVEGEAYFMVAKRSGSTFTVHTKEGLDIKVLGTVFNVNTRHSNVSVLLEEGRVQLKAASTASPLLMKPGEKAVYNQQTQSLQVAVAPRTSTDWTEGFLVLDHLTLQDIALYLKDTYNITLHLDDSLRSKQLQGRVAIGNLAEFIENVATSLELEVRRQGNAYELYESNTP